MPKHRATSQFRLKPGSRLHLADFDPAWNGGEETKKDAEELIARNLKRLTDAQELLWATERFALLIVLQAMDTAGKDGLIKHVMSGVNPQSCQVSSFKQPSVEELEHDFLWRYTRNLPARGRIGIFNRSYYEEVLVVRVHPEWLQRQNLAPPADGSALWQQRYQDINHFERHLARNGTVILKFFLHLSKKEQRERLLERLNNPDKHWKFSQADLAERTHWDEYKKAYEEALEATSTDHAPWYIIPADHKWVSRWLVSEILADTIERLDLKFPAPDPAKKAALAKARKLLEKE